MRWREASGEADCLFLSGGESMTLLSNDRQRRLIWHGMFLFPIGSDYSAAISVADGGDQDTVQLRPFDFAWYKA